jgi:hypothetical protein
LVNVDIGPILGSVDRMGLKARGQIGSSAFFGSEGLAQGRGNGGYVEIGTFVNMESGDGGHAVGSDGRAELEGEKVEGVEGRGR